MLVGRAPTHTGMVFFFRTVAEHWGRKQADAYYQIQLSFQLSFAMSVEFSYMAAGMAPCSCISVLIAVLIAALQRSISCTVYLTRGMWFTAEAS